MPSDQHFTGSIPTAMRRRSFLHGVGAGAAAALANAAGIGRAADQNRKLRVAVAGLGRGMAHIQALLKIPDVEIVSLAEVDPQRLALPPVSPLVVETAGGLLVPLRRDWLQIEQIAAWGLPVLLVARSGLGTLNHTLLSLEALRLRRIPVLGVLLNGEPHPNNATTLHQLGAVPLLGCLPPLPRLDGPALAEQWQRLDLSHRLGADT